MFRVLPLLLLLLLHAVLAMAEGPANDPVGNSLPLAGIEREQFLDLIDDDGPAVALARPLWGVEIADQLTFNLSLRPLDARSGWGEVDDSRLDPLELARNVMVGFSCRF